MQKKEKNRDFNEGIRDGYMDRGEMNECLDEWPKG